MSRTRLSRAGRRVRGVKTAPDRREEALTDHKRQGRKTEMSNSDAHRGSMRGKTARKARTEERRTSKRSVAGY